MNRSLLNDQHSSSASSSIADARGRSSAYQSRGSRSRYTSYAATASGIPCVGSAAVSMHSSMHTMAADLDLEMLLEQIGGMGMYQKLLVLLISLMFGFNGMTMLSFLFNGRNPTLACVDQAPDSACIAAESVCSYRNVNASGVMFEPATTYDSYAAEWGLVCQNSYLNALLTSIMYAGLAVGAPLAGRVADLFGRRPCVLVGFFLSQVGHLLLAFAPGPSTNGGFPVWGVLCKFLQGFGLGTFTPGAFVIVMEFVLTSHRSQTVGVMWIIWTFFVSMNTLVAYCVDKQFERAAAGVVVSTADAEHMGDLLGFTEAWRASQFIISLPGLATFVIAVLTMSESPRFLLAQAAELAGRPEAKEVGEAAADKDSPHESAERQLARAWKVVQVIARVNRMTYRLPPREQLAIFQIKSYMPEMPETLPVILASTTTTSSGSSIVLATGPAEGKEARSNPLTASVEPATASFRGGAPPSSGSLNGNGNGNGSGSGDGKSDSDGHGHFVQGRRGMYAQSAVAEEDAERGPRVMDLFGSTKVLGTPIWLVTTVICMLWFAVNVVYFGVSIYASSMPGSIYVNVLLSYVVQLPCYVFTGPACESFGRRVLMWGTLLQGGVCMIALGFLNSITSLNGNQGLSSLAFLSLLGIGLNFSVIYVITPELFPTDVRALALGVANIFARIGSLLAPQVIELEFLSPTLPPFIFGATALGGALAAYLLLPESKDKPLADRLLAPRLHHNDFHIDDRPGAYPGE